MALANIQLDFPTINTSAQVGDIVYYSHSGQNTGGFNNTSLGNTIMLGPIIEIIADPSHPNWIGPTPSIIVQYNDDFDLPEDGDFISFAKSKKINTSSLLGYYADVNFVNYDNKKIELFSVGSEVSESSK